MVEARQRRTQQPRSDRFVHSETDSDSEPWRKAETTVRSPRRRVVLPPEIVFKILDFTKDYLDNEQVCMSFS